MAVDRARVFTALTQPDELARWWADEARVQPEVGSVGEFRFQPPAGVLRFEVAELDAGEKVSWIFRQRAPEWTGTSVMWRLTPVPGGTCVDFTHAEFARWIWSMNRHAGIGNISWTA
ncbi:MAG: SRPBCC family protein [Ktedonobacterales bacterium]